MSGNAVAAACDLVFGLKELKELKELMGPMG